MFSREVRLREAMKRIIAVMWQSGVAPAASGYTANDVIIGLESGAQQHWLAFIMCCMVQSSLVACCPSLWHQGLVSVWLFLASACLLCEGDVTMF
jgi:hypothetical protein